MSVFYGSHLINPLRKIQASIAPGACLLPFLLLVDSLRIALIEIYWRIAATHRYNIRSAFG
jgi:hypothetical protein